LHLVIGLHVINSFVPLFLLSIQTGDEGKALVVMEIFICLGGDIEELHAKTMPFGCFKP